MSYLKRPVTVEAFQYGHEDEPDWFKQKLLDGVVEREPGVILIHTPTGDTWAAKGEWIVYEPHLKDNRHPKARKDVYRLGEDVFASTFAVLDVTQ